MTAQRLLSLASLRREITRTKKRIATLERRKVTDEVAQVLLASERVMLEGYLSRVCREEKEIIDFVNNIEDARLREIFMLRYFDGVRSWQKVAFLVGEYDESYIRRKHHAYLKKVSKIL